MAAALQANAPRIVGRYVLYGEIASGGMATVHFGRLLGPAGFARPVAIKRLHAQFARDPDFVKMFLDEARLAARIAHPNVVPTLDVVAADDEVFLVMDYVRGAALGQLVRTVRRRGERVRPLVGVGVVSGMLQGLHAAHEAKNDRGERLDLVHRDVSPQNVLVGTDGIPRLLDFGVAKASGRLQTTRDGQLKGKLAYMAPEQVRGDPLTRRTDIYAASVVLWEVLTGKRLFYAENEASVLARVLNADVPAPSSLVPELARSLDRVVLRGLERDPAKRYATAREMAADLDACIGVASPTEIGEWVEATATDELRERATHIAEIERSASDSAEIPPQLTVAPASARDATRAHSKRPREAANTMWGLTTKKEGIAQSPPSLPPETSQPETSPLRSRGMSLGTGSSPGADRRRWAFAAAAVVLFLLGFVVFSQARARRTAFAPAAGTRDHASAVPSSLSAAAAGGTAARADTAVPVGDLPPARGPAASAGAAPNTAPGLAPGLATGAAPTHWPAAGPALAPAASPTPPAVPSPARMPRAPAAPTPQPTNGESTGGPSSAECNPPYTADSKGHIHFKPNCI